MGFPDNVVNEVNEKLGLLDNPSESQIRSIVQESARLGAAEDPTHADAAAKSALDYYNAGMSPQDAASAGAMQTRQQIASERPTLQSLGESYANTSDSSGDGFTDWRHDVHDGFNDFFATGKNSARAKQKVDNFIKDQNLNLSSEHSDFLAEIQTGYDSSNVDPELASQAVAATANAMAGGTLTAPGMEITGHLKAKVHGDVQLDFKNAWIKTVRGAATYTHSDKVHIKAPSSGVYLKSSTMVIDAQDTEINEVSNSKFSRKLFGITYSWSDWNQMHVSGLQTNFTGLAYSLSVSNAHLGLIKFGYARRQATRGGVRLGVKGIKISQANSRLKKIGGLLSLGPIVLLMIL